MNQEDEVLWDEIMKEVDQDGNQQISYAEFSQAMVSVIQMRSSTLKRGEI